MITANNKYFKIGAIALTLSFLGIAGLNAEAYRGNNKVMGPNFNEERHAEMTKAFETNNYEAWKNLMQGKGRVTEVINKDNFDKFVKAYSLIKNGDIEGAKKIKQELGLELRDEKGKTLKEFYGRGFNRIPKNN